MVKLRSLFYVIICVKSVHFKKTFARSSSFKIVVVFNITSADSFSDSADVVHIENDNDFERNEDRATV